MAKKNTCAAKISWYNKTMQKNTFPDGGFVLHKIFSFTTKGHHSAWYDKDGNLLDAEHIILLASRPVKRGGPVWRELDNLGKVWK